MKKTIPVNNFIMKQIANRYESVDITKCITQQQGFGIIDTVAPYEEYLSHDTGAQYYKFKVGCVAISEPIAKRFNVPQLHISELCTIFGHTKTSINKLLLNVKKKNINLGLIGFGGTGTNFFHWTSQMAAWTNTHNIFEAIIVSDNDYFDSINLLRVPFTLLQKKNTERMYKKTEYCNDYAQITKILHKSNQNISEKNVDKSLIYYGAPDLETRKLMHNKNIAFIAATHRDNACMLSLRPEIDTELMIETYGKINLSIFFLNHLKMTISFLEFLASDFDMTEIKKTTKTILEYDFAEENKDMLEHGVRIMGRTLYPVTANAKNRTEMEIR